MTGLVNRHLIQTLPLKASSIFAEVNGFAARILATLTYFNDCDYDIEGLFVFPQDERTTIVEFEATIEERHVYTEVREKDSVEIEKSAYAIEEREDELFSLSIGRIPPQCAVFVQVSLITELLSDLKTRGSLFVLPSVFTPRLSTQDDSENHENDRYGSQMLITDIPRKTFHPYSFELQLEVVAPSLLAGCSSRTHAIQVDADSRATNASRIHITIAEPHTYDRELEVLLHLSHPYDPYVLIEEGKKVLREKDNFTCSTSVPDSDDLIENFAQKPAVMINFTPQLKAFSKTTTEFQFLVDRSGSMSGKHIFQVKETLILFLKSLPANCYFNIIGFGSYYRSLFQESQQYTEETLDKAITYVQKMRADLGGTNLILPLDFIFDQPRKNGVPRVIFMLTDGGVSNPLDVVDLVRKNANTNRFYTFGIGPEACPYLVQSVAGSGSGKSWFLSEEERIPPKVMEALNESLRPAITDIEISWHLPEGYDVIQSPCKVPFVFDGERLVLYGLLSRPPGEEKESPRTPQRRRMDRTMRSFSNNSVKVFWFDDDMEYLPEEQLLLEIEEQERFVNEEGNENFYHIEQEFGSRRGNDPSGFNNQCLLTSKPSSGAPLLESQENSDYLTMHKSPSSDYDQSTSPSRDHDQSTIPSHDQSFSNSSRMDENNVIHNIVVGDFFKDIDKMSETVPFNNGCKEQSLNKVENEQHPIESNKVSTKNAQSKRQKYALEKEAIEKGEKEDITIKENTIQSNRTQSGEQENDDGTSDACDSNKETAGPYTSRYYERDSGVGFSMDDSDKPFEEELINNSPNIAFEEGKTEVRPPTEGETLTNEELECLESKSYNVIKNSELLEQLGLPKNFGAVSIKGYVGDEEIEQVIPFPINRSGGTSKRPTIHQLLARSLIRELQVSEEKPQECMRKIRAITKQAKIHSRLTAFTSVDQYCYEDEILSALQFSTKEESPNLGKRNVLSLERKCGYTTGLGRRLPSPEGSDQESGESESTHLVMGTGEEPSDLYRLDRSWTTDSCICESNLTRTTTSSRAYHTGRQFPPLSTRYVVGEKQTTTSVNHKPSSLSERYSPILTKPLKEYQPFVSLAKLQSKNGNWEQDEAFADCIGLPLFSIQQASPLADSTVCVSKDLEELMKGYRCDYSTQLWATALGLAWLCRQHRDYRDEWFLLARKADTWLEECEYPRGFTPMDVKKLAYQALVLLHRNDLNQSPDSPSDKTKRRPHLIYA